jgi:PPOX class probable F420-dependent enzyme
MQLTAEQRAFLETIRAAVMITLRRDGTPHAVRVGIALVDGKLWSSGTQDRARTRHLRRDPRSTLSVIDSGHGFLTIESTVTLLEGADVPRQSVQLFRVMQKRSSGPLSWYGRQLEEDAFVEQMVREQRLIYQFEPQRIYGMG